MKVTTVGIDLAKNVFQLHGVNEFGKPVVKKHLRRKQMAEFFVNLPTCLIGMEACGSAHYWARKLQGFGHTVKLMAPQFVKPYVKTNKNDAADAEAICEAVTRPNMRFVPIKNVEQQSVLALHRVRQGFVKARTAQANQIRGLLSEFGLIIPQGIGHIANRVPELIEDASNELPGSFRLLVQRLLDHLKELDTQVDELESQIVKWHRQSEASGKLASVPGIGLITASALVATIGDAKNFVNGRQRPALLPEEVQERHQDAEGRHGPDSRQTQGREAGLRGLANETRSTLMSRKTEIVIEDGSTNVYTDLGYSPPVCRSIHAMNSTIMHKMASTLSLACTEKR